MTDDDPGDGDHTTPPGPAATAGPDPERHGRDTEPAPTPTAGPDRPRPGVPLSVLDLSTVAEGATSTAALADTTALAVRADRLGYRRFWVAEHHNTASVASTVPAVLIAHLAGATTTIAVGSGGVMLPNHAPLAIAEQFALLEALHPGRIDLGVGRAPGTDRATAVALRRGADGRDEEDFPRNLIDVMGLLGDRRSDHGLWDRFVATPAATSSPTVVLLGSSGFSAQLAGILGLPFGFAHHFDMGGTLEAVGIYRDVFEPSPVLAEPYVIVTASVLAADTTADADRLAAPARLRRYGLRTGRLHPVVTPEAALAHPDYPQAAAMGTSALVGTGDEVAAGLVELRDRTDASELMLHVTAHDLASRIHTLDLTAAAWGIGPPTP